VRKRPVVSTTEARAPLPPTSGLPELGISNCRSRIYPTSSGRGSGEGLWSIARSQPLTRIASHRRGNPTSPHGRGATAPAARSVAIESFSAQRSRDKKGATVQSGRQPRHDGIDSHLDKLLPSFRRFPCPGIKRECGEGGFPNAAAAPATVSGESFVMCHWESRSWEGDARYRPASQETCRQPWSHAKMSVGEYRH
jgi:hypothetical protein